MGWQDDPVVGGAPSGGAGGGWQNDPIVKGGASTQSASDTDYSKSPWSAAARTLAESASLGAGDLIYSHLAGTSLAREQAKTQAAAASLPWYYRYPLEVGGYTLGAGSLLSGVPEALGVGGVGAMALEGGLAGGASAALHSGGDLSLGNILPGAAGGAALGGVAGGLTKGVNKGLQAALGKEASVNPATAEATTLANKQAKYDDMHAPTAPAFDAKTVSQPYVDSINSLTDVQKQDASGLMKKMQDHVNLMQQKGQVSAGEVDEFARSIQNAASSANGAEQILANRVRDGLVGDKGVLATAPTVSGHPVGQAYQMLGDAKDAFKQWKNAQALKDLQEQQQYFNRGPGAAPQNIAQKYYDPSDPEFQALVDISQANQASLDPSWSLAHGGGLAGAGIGAHVAGPVGAMVGHQLGYLGTKALTKKFTAGRQASRLARAYQQAYPALTGVPLTGGTQAPQTGEMIKNLMLGGAY